MALRGIFTAIDQARNPDELFDLACEFFQGQGFGSVCYVAPESAAGPYILRERGMPGEWIERYRAQELHRFDPVPGMAFQLGHPARFDEVIKSLPSLNADEQAYMEALKASGMTNGILVPTYGPYGRPALIGLTQIAHPDLLDEIDVPYLSAVAQQIHNRMELLQVTEPFPGLSPKEREILSWLAKGKSVNDIATITGSKPPTVATHIQRIYAKMQVHDRVNCVAKALARHYI